MDVQCLNFLSAYEDSVGQYVKLSINTKKQREIPTFHMRTEMLDDKPSADPFTITTHTSTRKQMSETQSPEVVLVSGGTDSISAVLDTGNDFCQSHLYCNYDMIIMCFIIYMGQIQGWWLLAENISGQTERQREGTVLGR